MEERLSWKAKAVVALWVAGILLALLKALRVIDWPWLWVTAPIWGPFAIVYALLLIVALFMGCARFLQWVSRNL